MKNSNRIASQNKRLKAYLQSGKKIHVFHPAKMRLRIGFLNSRVSELLRKEHLPISKKWITVPDVDGNPVHCIEYSLKKKKSA